MNLGKILGSPCYGGTTITGLFEQANELLSVQATCLAVDEDVGNSGSSFLSAASRERVTDHNPGCVQVVV